jgi:hypothetical protein
MASGFGSGTGLPAGVGDMLFHSRHRDSRYGKEVNGMRKRCNRQVF